VKDGADEGGGDGGGDGELEERPPTTRGLCGVFGCTLPHAHLGLCVTAAVGERSARRRQPAWMREMRGGGIHGWKALDDADGSEGGGERSSTAKLGGQRTSGEDDETDAEAHTRRLLTRKLPTGPIAYGPGVEAAQVHAPWGLHYAPSISVVNYDRFRKPCPLSASELRQLPPKATSKQGSRAVHAGSAVVGGGTAADSLGEAAEASPHWVAPPIGSSVQVEVNDPDGGVTWQRARVRSHRHLYGQTTSFTACVNGDEEFIERFNARDEGKEWRRLMPRKGDTLEVEVEDDGEVEWRRALVTKRAAATGEFSVIVCFPDGTPDPDFHETFRLEAEGREWRRA